MDADTVIKAVVQKVVPGGKHGPFAVATSEGLGGSVTFSLEPTIWQEKEWPEEGMYVLLGKLRQKRAGWRAKTGRFFKPSDEQTERSIQMKVAKIEVVNEAIAILRGYEQSDVRLERDAAIEKLQKLQGNVDAMSMEFEVFASLGALQSKLNAIGATAEATMVEKLNYLIFTDGDTQPWWSKEPEREPDSVPNPDTDNTGKENEECLAGEVKCDLNCGEMPTIVLSRTEINVLCVTKRNHPDTKSNLPIAWHQPITGKAVIEVVGVQMGETQIPMETRVIFKGKRCKVQYFRTGLSGSVHGLCIEAIDTDNGRFNEWDLYTDVPTKKGKKHGIASPPR